VKLRCEKEESGVQTIDSALVTAVVALCVAALMVHPGVSKRQLTWRGGRTVNGDGGREAADNDGRYGCASPRL
jgi:hypothetical protein